MKTKSKTSVVKNKKETNQKRSNSSASDEPNEKNNILRPKYGFKRTTNSTSKFESEPLRQKRST